MASEWSEWKKLRYCVAKTVQIWGQARSSLMSAALAYYTMLSLSPILVLAVIIAGFFFGEQLAESTLLFEIGQYTSPEIEETARTVLINSSRGSNSLFPSLISLGVLLFGASGVFVQLHDTFNAIWGVPIDSRSGFRYSIRQRLVGLSLVGIIGLLLLSTLALSATISIISTFFADRLPAVIPWLVTLERYFIFLVFPLSIMALFRFLPDREIKWGDVWLGGLLTSGLLVLSRRLIGIYLQTSTVTTVYGAAGSVVVLLIWVYFSGMILFLGAAFCRAYAKTYGSIRQAKVAAQAAKTNQPV